MIKDANRSESSMVRMYRVNIVSFLEQSIELINIQVYFELFAKLISNNQNSKINK
jgi:hypothetical protein